MIEILSMVSSYTVVLVQEGNLKKNRFSSKIIAQGKHLGKGQSRVKKWGDNNHVRVSHYYTAEQRLPTEKREKYIF
jgi:hypothetical protein